MIDIDVKAFNVSCIIVRDDVSMEPIDSCTSTTYSLGSGKEVLDKITKQFSFLREGEGYTIISQG